MVQSVFALMKARKRAFELGFTKEQINKTISSSMVFSLAPSLAILLGLVTLTKVFGSMIAGMRLATLGAVTYELPAALNVINGVFGLEIGDVLTTEMVITAIWVMTLGCIPPLLIVPFFLQKNEWRLETVERKRSIMESNLDGCSFLGDDISICWIYFSSKNTGWRRSLLFYFRYFSICNISNSYFSFRLLNEEI